MEQATGGKEELISAAEAARLLGVDRSAIWHAEQRGKLTPVRVEWEGRRRRPLFERADVEALKPPDPSV